MFVLCHSLCQRTRKKLIVRKQLAKPLCYMTVWVCRGTGPLRMSMDPLPIRQDKCWLGSQHFRVAFFPLVRQQHSKR